MEQIIRPGQAAPQGEQPPKPARDRNQGFKLWLKAAREWARIHLRRWNHLLHGAAAGNVAAVGPISFLLVACALGTALTMTTLYSISYAVTVDGQPVGAVADQGVVDQAIQEVEKQGSQLLGYDYRVDDAIDYRVVLTLKSDLKGTQEISNYFYGELSEISDQLRAYQVVVDGRSVGTVQDREALNAMLDGIKEQYVTQDTVSSGFVENMSVNTVYAVNDLMSIQEVEQALTSNTTGETTYTAVRGDTYNSIAYANDMSVSDLLALNPQADPDRLREGDVLNVKEVLPALSVRTVDHITYTEPMACPIEEVKDDSMYQGDSKILTQGEEGEARVEADVVCVNGAEQERTITKTTTLREATATVKAVGTKEKPKTASKGTFKWPVSSHRINSYFGSRTLRGRRNFHTGLDLRASYGESVKAADGGKVTFAGRKGNYGNLVIITHDSGIQTYYAHNSRLVVSAGQRVYQGQVVAKAGSTGNSTGVHCHFEVRVHGNSVNPLNYLK